MRQSVQFPMKLVSENTIRTVNPKRVWAIREKHKRQKAEVLLYLNSQLRRPRLVLEEGFSNRFIVRLCRISAGFLDHEDNLTGAFKHVKDTVADWLELDDRDRRIDWRYQQQPCPRGWAAVRITIDDEVPGGEVITVVGASPPVLGAVSDAVHGGRPRRGEVARVDPDPRAGDRRGSATNAPGDGSELRGGRAGAAVVRGSAERAAQRPLVFLRAFAILPWDQDGGEPIVTELQPFADGTDAPVELLYRIPPEHVRGTIERFPASVIRGTGPGAGISLRFRRKHYHDDDLGGDCWLYTIGD